MCTAHTHREPDLQVTREEVVQSESTKTQVRVRVFFAGREE